MTVQFVGAGTQFFDLFGQSFAADQHRAIQQFDEMQMTFINPVVNFAATALAQGGGSFGGDQADFAGALVATRRFALFMFMSFLISSRHDYRLVFFYSY